MIIFIICGVTHLERDQIKKNGMKYDYIHPEILIIKHSLVNVTCIVTGLSVSSPNPIQWLIIHICDGRSNLISPFLPHLQTNRFRKDELK